MNLQSLILHGSSVTDESLAHLAGLRKLQSLRIFGNFTDAAVPYFEKLPRLRHLQLYSSNEISPNAKQRLEARFPDPRRVSIETDRSIVVEGRILSVGDDAPLFEAETLDGEPIRLSEYRGKAVLLYFWATWCSPCIQSLPGLKQLHDELSSRHGDRFAMISLAMDNEAMTGRIRELVGTHELTWPQMRIGHYSNIAANYGVVGAPSYFVIGPDGKIASTSRDWNEIQAAVGKALKDARGSVEPETESTPRKSSNNRASDTEGIEERVTIRLAPEKSRWQLGETPVVRAIIRGGESPDSFPISGEVALEVEWDGVWYIWTGPEETPTPATLGKEPMGIQVRLVRENWGIWHDRTKPPQPLQVSFGKHPLRVAAFVAKADGEGQLIKRKIVSDPIEIEIHDDAGIGAVAVE